MNPIVSPDVRDAYFGSLDKAFEGFTFVDDSLAQLMCSGQSTATSMANSLPKSGGGATLLAQSRKPNGGKI